MRIYGLDFTSAPRRQKPLTLAVATFTGEALRLDTVRLLTDFAAFEAWLASPGPWAAGLDFPFGQPARLIDHFGWGATWAETIRSITALGDLETFAAVIKAYRDRQPPGDKHHKRPVDRLARSISPMMLHGVPVGRMFFRGAPRLLASGASILPNHPTDSDRVVLETYPALVARRFTTGGYKSDTRRQQTGAHRAARQHIIDGLRADCPAHFGFALHLPADRAAALVADPTGDQLDALLCAVEAAWACTRRGHDWGIPPGVDPREGWIVDPDLR